MSHGQRTSRRGAVAAAFAGLFLAGCTEQAPGAGLGQKCQVNGDCYPGLVCEAGACTLARAWRLCEPGARTCAGLAIMVCDSGGDRWRPARAEEGAPWHGEPCPHGCQDGACREPVCVPGAVQCFFGTVSEVRRCRADGFGWEPLRPCLLGCDSAGAACAGQACEPGAVRCADGAALEVCGTAGTWSRRPCDPGQACTTDPPPASGARCLSRRCTPGAQRCDGAAVVRCADDGSGESFVADCPLGCVAPGACRAPACEPGERRCAESGTALLVCDAFATGWTEHPCGPAGLGVCREADAGVAYSTARCIVPCTGQAPRCEGSRVVACGPDGEREQIVADCPLGCVADAGGARCAAAVCTPGARRCSAAAPGVLEVCTADGRAFAPAQICPGACLGADAAGPARCEQQACAPGFARCAANPLTGRLDAVERCDGTGKSWLTTACGPDQECLGGACVQVDRTCLDGARRCRGWDVERCATLEGTAAWVPVGACLTGCADGTCDAGGGCTPLTLAVASGFASLPGDGRSRFVVESAWLQGPDGAPVPDGTLATLEVRAEDPAESSPEWPAQSPGLPAILDPDADERMPGLQVATAAGRLRVRLRMTDPLLDAARLRAQVAGRAVCAGEVALRFFPTTTLRADSPALAQAAAGAAGPRTIWLFGTGAEPLPVGIATDGKATPALELRAGFVPSTIWQ